MSKQHSSVCLTFAPIVPFWLTFEALDFNNSSCRFLVFSMIAESLASAGPGTLLVSGCDNSSGNLSATFSGALADVSTTAGIGAGGLAKKNSKNVS